MQVPILNGGYTDGAGDFRTALPVNMIPVPKQNGISSGYLRPADGILSHGVGPGDDRGGIVWRGEHYRAMGGKLVRVANGLVEELGELAGVGPVTFDYSFDCLGIAAGGSLYYWNGTLTQVTDPDLGNVVDMVWVDGYFMTTDGEYLVVTELNDRTSVNPLKYGSSEADPDPVKGLLKLRNEVYALNRHTIELFDNVGGTLFPFERNEAGQIQRGVLGTHCAVVYADSLAFLGSARNEAPAVWLGQNGGSQKLSTREIDVLLEAYDEATLAQAELETRTLKGHQLLYLHLPDKTLVYDLAASMAVEEPVWFVLSSSLTGTGRYRARHFVWHDNLWQCGDPGSANIGILTDAVSSHYGEVVGWEFGTSIIYNEGRGALFHELELVALPGRCALGADPVVWTSHSEDGETWSKEVACPAGKIGERNARIKWRRQGRMRQWRLQKFRGTSDARLSFARLDATLEPLNV